MYHGFIIRVYTWFNYKSHEHPDDEFMIHICNTQKLWVSFAEYRLFYRSLLQKWPIKEAIFCKWKWHQSHEKPDVPFQDSESGYIHIYIFSWHLWFYNQYIHVYSYMCVHVYISGYIHIYVCIYVYIHIYIHMYTYTCICWL